MRYEFIGAALALAALSGCVSQGKYDSLLADAERLRADQKTIEVAAADCRAQNHKLERDVARLESLRQQLEIQVAMTADTSADRKQLLADYQKRLDELKRAQAATEARAELFRSLAFRLKKMIDSGQLEIKLRDGRMVLVLPTDVLFDSGKTQIKPAGRRALEQVSNVLGSLNDRHFQVAGHTDDEPIKFSGYASNWELSTARAVEIVHFFNKLGMRPEVLSAAGYGEFDPVSPNDTALGRAKNRRIEITLQPNIEEFVAVP